MTIDPTIDCVFKAILGDPKHDNILINFLNAILGFKNEQQIKSVQIEDPFNPKSFQTDKLSILDVKAQDQQGRFFQTEVQLANYQNLPNRIIHNWSKIVSSLLKEGEGFKQLKPVFSIWLLPNNLFKEADGCHLPFQIYNWEHRLDLLGYPPIHLLQLQNWREGATLNNDKQRWLKLFKDGKNLDFDNLPEGMDTPIMRQVGQIMRLFEKTGPLYRQYISREQAIREHITLLEEREDAQKLLQTALIAEKQARAAEKQARAEKEQARAAEKQARAEKEQARAAEKQARAEKEALLQLLREKGVDLSKTLTSLRPDDQPSD